jgi:hypothetical protein
LRGERVPNECGATAGENQSAKSVDVDGHVLTYAVPANDKRPELSRGPLAHSEL